jgi:hypothetical protein
VIETANMLPRASRLARVGAAVTAIVSWCALALQLLLIVKTQAANGMGLGGALWLFFGYFTILTNLLVACVSTALASGHGQTLGKPRARFVTVTAIVLVGLVYSLALRSTWNPTGWQAVADHALHDATPVLFALTWLLFPHDRLDRHDLLWALAWPAGYCAYAFARGAIDGWYAYWFMDPGRQEPAQLAVSILILLSAFLLLAAAFLWLDRWMERRARA